MMFTLGYQRLGMSSVRFSANQPFGDQPPGSLLAESSLNSFGSRILQTLCNFDPPLVGTRSTSCSCLDEIHFLVMDELSKLSWFFDVLLAPFHHEHRTEPSDLGNHRTRV